MPKASFIVFAVAGPTVGAGSQESGYLGSRTGSPASDLGQVTVIQCLSFLTYKMSLPIVTVCPPSFVYSHRQGPGNAHCSTMVICKSHTHKDGVESWVKFTIWYFLASKLGEWSKVTEGCICLCAHVCVCVHGYETLLSFPETGSYRSVQG